MLAYSPAEARRFDGEEAFYQLREVTIDRDGVRSDEKLDIVVEGKLENFEAGFIYKRTQAAPQE